MTVIHKISVLVILKKWETNVTDGIGSVTPTPVLLWVWGNYHGMFFAKPQNHDDVIKWKHFPRYWPFVRRIHRSPVNSPHKDQWHGALMFSLNYVWINGWVNNREAGDLRRYRAHYDVTVMTTLTDDEVSMSMNHKLHLKCGRWGIGFPPWDL